MSRGELRAARGPATIFGLDDASRHRDAEDAARAIIAHAATSRASTRAAPPARAGKRLPPARPAQSPPAGRAGHPSSRVDGEIVLCIALGILIAVLIAGISFLARNAAHGGLWL